MTTGAVIWMVVFVVSAACFFASPQSCRFWAFATSRIYCGAQATNREHEHG